MTMTSSSSSVARLSPGQYLVFAQKDNPQHLPWIFTVDVATDYPFEYGERGVRWVHIDNSGPVRLKKKK